MRKIMEYVLYSAYIGAIFVRVIVAGMVSNWELFELLGTWGL